MYRLLTYILLLFASSVNCVSPYNYEPEEVGSFLVVSGGINQLDAVNRIRLTWSTPYQTYSNARAIEGAQIVLVNSKNESEPFYYEEEGWYAHYGAQVPIQVGESYHIEIENLGKRYRTDIQTVPEPILADSISYHVGFNEFVNKNGSVITNEIIEVFINTPINVGGEISYLRWKTDESWSLAERSCHPLATPKVCYVNDPISIDQIFIYSTENISGDYLPQKLVGDKINPKRIEFLSKHYFNVSQLTLNKKTYEYWEKVVQLANPDGDIFDLPPAPLPGNVYNVDNKNEIVLGYFEVTGKSITRKALYRNDIDPLRVPDKDYLCSYWGGYGPICCNCLLLDGSTLERPDYWD